MLARTGTGQPEMDYQFFISYASEDFAEAQAVCTLLERPGVTCWMAPDSIMPGESYVRAIPKAIRESTYLVRWNYAISGFATGNKEARRPYRQEFSPD